MKGKRRVSLLAVLVCVFALVLSLGLMTACGDDSASTEEPAATAQWYYGAEVPAETLGTTGDYYLDTESLRAYVRAANGQWQQTALYSGAGVPNSADGAKGDLYLDTENGVLYQKGDFLWEIVLKVEKGEKGRDGVLWFSGDKDPENVADALAGDFYLNTTEFTVWQLGRDGETWTKLGSIKGHGTTWFEGTLEPADADLQDVYEGDFYYRTYIDLEANTSNYQIYHYESGEWILKTSVVAGTIGDEFTKPDGSSYLDVAEDGTVTVTGAAEGTTDLTVPGVLNGKPVEIGAKAFQNNKKLISVTLEEGVKEIGSDAFRGCSSLTDVTLSEGLESIGGMAFRECTSLQNVVLPSSVREIGAYAFCLDSDLETVTFPENLESIGAGAFVYCSSLKGVDFSGCTNLKEIGLNAFAYSTFETVTLPESLKELGSGAFSFNTHLTSVTLPDNLTAIKSATFYQCKALTDVKLPANVTEIGPMAFEETKIANIEFPNGLEEIGYQAFYNCDELESIVLPDTVTKIGEMAFCNCSNAKTIKLSANLTAIPKWAFQYCDGVTELTIPNGVREIGFNAFVSCEKLPEIHLPASVTSIVEGAFIDYKGSITVDANNPSFEAKDDLLLSKGENRTLLWAKLDVTSVTIPNDVKRIGNYAFDDRKQLTEITVPEGVTSIGLQAFHGCDLLAEITLPTTLESIGQNAFSETAYYNTAENWSGEAVENGTLYMGPDGQYLIRAYGATDGAAAVKDGTAVIAESAFSDSGNLEDLVIPASVISIGANAFRACSKLTEVTVPAGVKHIGGGAFNAKTKITIAAGNDKFEVRTVENSDGNWSYLVEKETMTLLWANLAEGCTKIIIPDGIKTVASGAFRSCTALTDVVVSASVTVIEEEAFSGCSGLVSVTFNGAVSIGENAFASSALKTVTFEVYSTAMKIHNGAFRGLNTITSIVFGGTKAEWKEWMHNAKFLVTHSQQITVTCKGETGADNTMVYVSGEEQ